jgi:hypothetical protein
LTRAADALFNTVDALLTETIATSFVELSLSPFFERGWASLYEAFEDGRIDGEGLGKVMIAHLPRPLEGERRLLGTDASGITRPESRTAADRTTRLVHNLPNSRTPPLTAGWQFSSLMVLADAVRSWGSILANRRIESQQTPGEVAAVQLRACEALLPQGLRPLLRADRSSPSAAFVPATAAIAWGKLRRWKRRRVFYRRAPAPTGKGGAPRKEGERFACHDPSTHGAPWAHWEGEEPSGQRIEVEAWEHWHMSKAPEVELTVIGVRRFGASDKKRDRRVSWFVWIDQEPAPLQEMRPLYGRRFGMEHPSRFTTQEWLWGEPRLRTPEPLPAAHALLAQRRQAHLSFCGGTRFASSHLLAPSFFPDFFLQYPPRVRKGLPS